MNQSNIFDEISQVTQALISEDCGVEEARRFTESLGELLGKAAEMGFENPQQIAGSTHTDHGLALSPMLAANCALIHVRTQQFLRGVNQCLMENKSQDAPLEILYAGCGPYATLIFPLLCVHRGLAINLTVIDIFAISIDSVARLIQAAHFDKVNLKARAADATKWHPECESQKFDLIISETMDRALIKEPQVSIFRQLQQFLKPQGKLIPEQVTVLASIIGKGQFLQLEPVFKLNRASSELLFRQNQNEFTGEIVLPRDTKNQCTRLLISTEIHIYGRHYLYPNVTDITTDLSFRYLDFQQQDTIPYTYSMGGIPGFTFQLHHYQPPLPPESLDIKTRSGTPYLYVFWHNAVWNFHKPRLTEGKRGFKTKVNWDDVLALHDAYEADLQESIHAVLAEHPPSFDRFENWFLEKYGELDDRDSTELNETIAARHKEAQTAGMPSPH